MKISDKRTPAFQDDDKIWFGKHNGERLQDIPASYLSWLYKTYLEEGLDKAKIDDKTPKFILTKIMLFNYIHNQYEALQMEFPNFGE